MHTIKRYLPVVARVLLGLLFLVFGLNGFLQFLPQPSVQMSPEAGQFMGGLMAAGYFFPLLKGTEVLAGLMLLSGKFVPLALVILAPIILNIAAVHIFLVPGLGMTVVIAALELYLAWAYRDAFRGVLNPVARPSEQQAGAPREQALRTA